MCTTKGSKEGKRQIRFLVGIAHTAGTTLCELIGGRMTGDSYAEVISREFDNSISQSRNPRARHVLQENCPVKNSAAARHALQACGISVFKIPARSPDLNPIENMFNQIKGDLKRQALQYHISQESERAFVARVKNTLLNWPVSKINNIIESMPRRMDMVVKGRGQRTKY